MGAINLLLSVSSGNRRLIIKIDIIIYDVYMCIKLTKSDKSAICGCIITYDVSAYPSVEETYGFKHSVSLCRIHHSI